ncbi:hypothetical protein RHS04_07242 [Rhizoctonia solani]|uniref:Uncharacterized protein n=1 Tax=Rhizoctonia solani TaxID=456999 RepID=A0A8H7LKI4_9AGAM|nr:hypothetical protein RHS04_07242 [Rhizoctonia solani]
MIETTGLAIPLDQWVCASARVARMDMLLRLYDSGPRNDYSRLGIDDALPLLSHACKASYGNFNALDFDIKSSQGPLSYSAVLTITGPDEIGIEFPDSDKHPTQLQAKKSAAYKAILGGAIGYIMQSASSAVNDSNKSPADLPPPLTRAAESIPKAGSSDTTKTTTTGINQGRKARGAKQKAPPDAMNLINTFLQRTYRDRKMTMPKSSQEWKVVLCGGGVMAHLTIRLPSGSSRSYGDLPGSSVDPAKIPNVYPSATVAKREVASDALKAGVLQFIKFDKTEAPMPPQLTSPTVPMVRAHGPLSSYVAYDPSKDKMAAAGKTGIITKVPRTLTDENVPDPPKSESESESSASSEEGAIEDSAEDVGPVPPLEQVLDSVPSPSHHGDLPNIDQSLSPIDEVEVVDDLLGPASVSNPEGSSEQDEEEVDELAPSEYGDDGAISEGQSEPMELESDAGTPIGIITVAPEKRPSPQEDEPEPAEKQPFKKQKTEPVENSIEGADQKPESPGLQVMVGPNYSSILSEFCFERGQAQPQVTYQRNFEHPKVEGPVMYSVSIILGSSRFELSKQYESIELGEEKLSKRILRQFGIRAKKI